MSSDENIIKSQFKVERYPYDSLIKIVFDSLAIDSNKICLIDCTIKRKWSKQQVLDSSLNFAYYLINDCGLKKGDIVCFVANNSDIHAIAVLGVLAAGAVYCSIVEDSSEDEIRIIANSLKPVIMVSTGSNHQKIQKIFHELSFIKKTLHLHQDVPNELNLDINEDIIEVILQRKRESVIALPRSGGLDDILTIVMSSGSTGRPKSIPRTNRNLISELGHLQYHDKMWDSTQGVLWYMRSLNHNGGLIPLLCGVKCGAQLALLRVEKGFDDIFEAIHENDINTMFFTPSLLNFLIKNREKYDQEYLKSLRNVYWFGTRLSEATYKSVLDNYGFPVFNIMFGMSETGKVSVIDDRWANLSNVTSLFGKLLPSLEAKVINENGVALGPNQQGELCWKGDNVTAGYLNNDEENAKLFTQDGFLKSGDLGYYDENELFYFVGRIKDIIKVKGHIVVPAELENILLQNSQVENAAVIGINDDYYGEVPLAFVTLIEGSTITPQQIQEFVDNRVNNIKKVRGGVRIIDEFPLTPVKKINKSKLKILVSGSV